MNKKISMNEIIEMIDEDRLINYELLIEHEEEYMELTRSDRKKLWSRARNQCSMCKRELFEDDVNLGKEAHIHSKNTNGPRYDKTIIKTETYENAILVCGICHDIIDQKIDEYTPQVLIEMKNKHENNYKPTMEDIDFIIYYSGTDEEFIREVYSKLLKNEPNELEIKDLKNYLESGSLNRVGIIEMIISSKEYQSKYS